MAPENKIRVLLADDQELVLRGVKAMLAGTDIKLVAAVTDGVAATKYALAHEVDVVLLDVCMPGGDGLTALGRLKVEKPSLPVLMFSAYNNPMCIARTIALGASGYLLKGCTRDELFGAIRTAAAGEKTWSPAELRRLSGALGTPRLAVDVEVSLTQREGDVLRQMASGLTSKEIAKVLDIGLETVKQRVQHVLRKIGLTDRTQAAVWAVRKGLV